MPTRRIAHLTEASYNAPYENTVGKTAGSAGELDYQSLSETWKDAIRGRAGSPGTRTHRRQHQKDLPRFAGDLDGFFDGPKDLSTNPRHLEGFGK